MQAKAHRRNLIETLKAVYPLLFLFLVLPAHPGADSTGNDIQSLVLSNLSRSKLLTQDCSVVYNLSADRFKCGFLQVPENYSLETGRLIKVPYLVIYPDAELFDTSLAPLLVTGGGGPGNAMLGSQQHDIDENEFWSYEQFSVADGRTLVVLENRGVGLSVPELDCHYPAEIFTGNIWQEMHKNNHACGRDHLENNIDLSQYNTHNAALDIEIFRRLFTQQGAASKQLNLYGISYGTHIAMHYERLFPKATRAMVLDSISISDQDTANEELRHAQRSFDLVFAQCRSNTKCHRQFGADLESAFYSYLNNIDERDISLPVNWPDNQQPISVPLTSPLIISVLHDALYSNYTIAGIPLTIKHLMEQNYGRFNTMLAQHIYTYSSRYGFSDTAFLTYRCFDESYSRKNHSRPEYLRLYKHWELDKGKEYMRRVCEQYGITSKPALQTSHRTSNTPTLFLSGRLDPVTPPASAGKAAKNFKYFWNIVRDSISHDVITHSSCARLLASWFIYHPQEDLDLIEAKNCETTDYTIDFELE